MQNIVSMSRVQYVLKKNLTIIILVFADIQV